MSAKVADEQAAKRQPSELKELANVLKEFLDKLSSVDIEIATLKEDRKALIEEYSDRLDMATLKKALRVKEIEDSVAHKDAYDNFIQALDKI